MDIYLHPEMMIEGAHILNVVNNKNQPVGYLTFVMNEKKMYVMGHCQDEGVAADFKDLVKPYIEGMAKSKEDMDVLITLGIGGKEIKVNEEGED